MKKITLSLVIITLAIIVEAQTPQAFKYQTIVRDAAGVIMANDSLSFRVSIRWAFPLGIILYRETHEVITNDFGLVSFEVGNGEHVSGSFTTIDWENNIKYLQIEMGPPGGAYYDQIGSSQLFSVPYSLYAEEASHTKNISDSDGDTYLTVEQNTDDDTIRFYVAGEEVMRHNGTALEMLNNDNCVFIGKESGSNDDGTDNQNVFVGEQAGFSNTSGGRNIFVGYQSGYSNTESHYNTYIGRQSGYSGTTAGVNTFVGHKSGYNNTSGDGNTFLGESSGIGNTGGDGNIYIGFKSGSNNNNGHDNIGIGGFANFYNQDGRYNTIIGSRAGYGTSLHEKTGNIFLGYKAGYFETGDNKLYIENSDADSVNALIYGEFDNKLLAFNARVGIGTSHPGATLEVAGPIWQTGLGYSVFVGKEAGENDDSTDNQNVFIGDQSGFSNTSGGKNVFIGYQSGYTNESGDNNTFIGRESGFSSTAFDNVFIGNKSGYHNTIGIGNSYLGHECGFHTSEGFHNAGFGVNNSYYNTTGFFNTNFGAFANYYNQQGSGNTVIGYAAGMGTVEHNKSYNVLIGFKAGFNETNDNRLYIENSDVGPDSALIYGEFDNNILTFNANVGIRTTEPDVPLHVVDGSDASLSDGGYIVTGQITSENIAVDDNEIMARENGLPNNLHINRDGDNVIINEFAGSVGIGSPSPQAKLHVNGAIRLGSGVRDYELLEVDPSYPDGWSSLTNYGGIGIGSNDGNNRQMFMFTDGGTTDNIFTVATSQNNGSTWEADLVIRQDGKVGVNIPTPARPLHISDVMRLEPRDSEPGSPSEGDLYVNDTDHHIYCYLGGIWKQLD